MFHERIEIRNQPSGVSQGSDRGRIGIHDSFPLIHPEELLFIVRCAGRNLRDYFIVDVCSF